MWSGNWLYWNQGPPNCTVHQILLWIWNCLRDNNYVLRFYRILLSGRLVWSSLGISGTSQLLSLLESSLEDQDKQQISFFVIHFWSASRNRCARRRAKSSRLPVPECFGIYLAGTAVNLDQQSFLFYLIQNLLQDKGEMSSFLQDCNSSLSHVGGL